MGECLITRRGGEAYELPVLNSTYPANVTVVEAANASVSFSVQIATPGKPAEYTYQWYLNGAAVGGATNSSYTKTGLTAAGTYTLQCVVTNKAGTVTSRVATLTVTSSKPTYTYTGSHQLIDDGSYNWRIKLLTSGTLTFKSLGNGENGIDVFCVGGGGGGTTGWSDVSGAGGGGSGYVSNQKKITLSTNSAYGIVIGAGGGANANGGNTTAFEFEAGGGQCSATGRGGNGGSGGGGNWGVGGCNGSNGNPGSNSTAGTGAGVTTREFGDTSGALYAYGGNGAWCRTVNGTGGLGSRDNNPPTNGETNSGSGAGNGIRTCAAGGSGIVVVRNAR